MKMYFMSTEETHTYRKNPDERIHCDKIKVKNGENEYPILDLIQNEMSAFQRTSNTMQLSQKAIVIDWESREPSKAVLEECAAGIQSRVQYWHVGAIKTPTQKSPFGILSDIPQKTFVKAAVNAGLIRLADHALHIGIAAFLICLLSLFGAIFLKNGFQLISAIFSQAFIYSFLISSLIGFTTFHIFKGRSYRNPRNHEVLLLQFKKESKDKSYNEFISSIAETVIENMPLAVIVEDLALLDKVSSDVVDRITRSNQTLGFGALLWIAFRSKSRKNVDTHFTNCSFPVKHYSL